jgi:hypothetical protein
MCIQAKKQLRELQIYAEIGQNIAIVEPVGPEKKEILRQFEEETFLVQLTIDFDKIDNICDLTKKILEQCESIVSIDEPVNADIVKADCTDDYYGLDKALNMLQGISEQIGKSVFFILKNYTHVLKIKDGERIQEHMRSVLQHQENVLCIFTGKEKALLNEIFMNPVAPFFRFVKIIDMR